MSTLGAWLAGEGFTVDDEDVPYGRDSAWYGVSHILVHHTVSPCEGSEYSIASYCRTGGPGTYPPLCQIMLGHSGKVWMTCRERSGQSDPGRASHAGSGSGYGVPDDAMNAYSLGIEYQCDGTHPIATHEKQYQALIELVAALCRRYDVPVAHVIGHKEWSTTGKVDPLDDMDVIRSDVAAALQPEEAPDMATHTYLNKAIARTIPAGEEGDVQWSGGSDDPTYSLNLNHDGPAAVVGTVSLSGDPNYIKIAVVRRNDDGDYEAIRQLGPAIDVPPHGRGVYQISTQGEVTPGDLLRLRVAAGADPVDIIEGGGWLSAIVWS